jgi:ribosomal-protein-alanine N-acetyltransferase
MAGTFAFPDDVPTLTDGEVTLRAHALSDVDELVVQCRDPESIRWTTVPVPYERDSAVTYVSDVVPGGWHARKDLGFAIEAAHADGVRRFAGSISLRPMDEGLAELAFGLHPGARGRGVCSRAVKLLLDWGFQQPDIDLVVWYANVGNWASWRVAWANGFTYDGMIKKYLPHRSERRDSWCGSLRADDTREPKHQWNDPPVLESARLRLRPDRETDAERMGEMMTDERIAWFSGRTLAARRTDGASTILRMCEGNARGDRINWCIADVTTDEMIGHIQLFGLAELDDTSAEVGYMMHPSARGRGVLTEALTMVVEWAFRSVADGGLGKRRLALRTAGLNAASRHAAEKAGFIQIATQPEAFPTGETGFDDEVIYAQLNPLWKP